MLTLWFVGLKMVLADVVTIPVVYSLARIGTILAASMAASVLHPERERRPVETPEPRGPTRADPSLPPHGHP